ncbi:(2Fe-2S)-binding protein [Glutamicibacter sp. JL.03c]|uniref:(2Fe-2S)-binding protein n=1 Tax=Glutamicibacter sp. JL.03c TaxID=2984842 RepID=UPI0021F75059|nr:(2Fe-2S)-binding protein [Glutamicibacter sp. JL.03c]UYQ76551.1 (2Fe-2S)-binding protein [Glutamicibacter sp. JL.03c]
MSDPTICRCEEVPLSIITSCLAAATGPISLREIKLQTRAGMGICQGRTCAPLLGRIVEGSDRVLAQDGAWTRNNPLRPISLADLAEDPAAWDEADR